MLDALVTTLGAILPRPLQQQIAAALPEIRISVARLAMEVVAAETSGLTYRDAAQRIDYPLMARVHFGVLDQLQSRPAPALRKALRMMIEHAQAGRCDAGRRLLFEIARRRDADAALARFFLFQAVRLNLYVNTWDEPLLEAWGSLARVEQEAERVIRELLELEEMHHPDVREHERGN